VRKF